MDSCHLTLWLAFLNKHLSLPDNGISCIKTVQSQLPSDYFRPRDATMKSLTVDKGVEIQAQKTPEYARRRS